MSFSLPDKQYQLQCVDYLQQHGIIVLSSSIIALILNCQINDSMQHFWFFENFLVLIAAKQHQL